MFSGKPLYIVLRMNVTLPLTISLYCNGNSALEPRNMITKKISDITQVFLLPYKHMIRGC